MTSAVVTPCSHLFHAGCLKKWLYVQETCPLCHSQLKGSSQPGSSTQDATLQEAPLQPAGGLDPGPHPESEASRQDAITQAPDAELTADLNEEGVMKEFVPGDPPACSSSG